MPIFGVFGKSVDWGGISPQSNSKISKESL